MKNNLKRMIKISMIIIMILVFNIGLLSQCVKAIKLDATQIKSGGDCGSLLTYRGIVVKTYYAYYQYGGKDFPAYCMDKTKQGVTNEISYGVSIEDSIHDVGLWRYIMQGYPYQSIESLGCVNKEEAYTATKQAIYCYIHGNQVQDYGAIGEAGQRTLNALKMIVEKAKKSTETQISNSVTIQRESDYFTQDKEEPNYISRIYSIHATAHLTNYTIELEQGEKELPEGIQITNLENEVKNTFSSNEKFKIKIPIQNLKDKGDYLIKVSTQVETKPVFYGKANQSSFQDYALTAETYEDSQEKIKEEYSKNDTKIKILKQEKESKKLLEGVEFNLYNDNKELLYTNLKTNEKGEILITNLIPGDYYLKETKALDGYLPYEEFIKIEVSLNQTATVTISNTKEEKTEIKIDDKKIEIEQQTKIRKLPVTGM